MKYNEKRDIKSSKKYNFFRDIKKLDFLNKLCYDFRYDRR